MSALNNLNKPSHDVSLNAYNTNCQKIKVVHDHKIYGLGSHDSTDETPTDGYMDPPIIQTDKYSWLRSDDRSNQEVLDVLNRENNLTKTVMSITEDLQKELFNEIKSHIQETYDTYPTYHNDKSYKYFLRQIQGNSYNIHVRINSLTNMEEILLDENELAKSYKTFNMGSFEITKDHKYMIYECSYNLPLLPQ